MLETVQAKKGTVLGEIMSNAQAYIKSAVHSFSGRSLMTMESRRGARRPKVKHSVGCSRLTFDNQIDLSVKFTASESKTLSMRLGRHSYTDQPGILGPGNVDQSTSRVVGPPCGDCCMDCGLGQPSSAVPCRTTCFAPERRTEDACNQGLHSGCGSTRSAQRGNWL